MEAKTRMGIVEQISMDGKPFVMGKIRFELMTTGDTDLYAFVRVSDEEDATEYRFRSYGFSDITDWKFDSNDATLGDLQQVPEAAKILADYFDIELKEDTGSVEEEKTEDTLRFQLGEADVRAEMAERAAEHQEGRAEGLREAFEIMVEGREINIGE